MPKSAAFHQGQDMHEWLWKEWQGTPFLTCGLLEEWPHGFFTRRHWPQTPHELVPAVAAEAEVFRIKQVHGNAVLCTSETQQHQPTHANPFPDADGLVSNGPAQAVWVCSADCTPVLLADSATGTVAAVHAGWRGTAAQIVPQAVKRLQAKGCQLHNLKVAIGPAIAGEVYQVTTEVAAKVGRTVMDEVSQDTDQAVVEALMELPRPPISADEEPGRARLHVSLVNVLQLEQMGVPAENIAIAPHCTYQEPLHFFSYRRDQKKNVQWSGIVSRALA